MYLRAREDPAMLRVALASAFALGTGRLSPAAVALGSGQRWGEKAGSARGFIGRVSVEIRKGSREGLGTFQTTPVSFHRGRAIGGRRKENAGGGKGSSGKKKGKKERALTGGAGA